MGPSRPKSCLEPDQNPTQRGACGTNIDASLPAGGAFSGEDKRCPVRGMGLRRVTGIDHREHRFAQCSCAAERLVSSCGSLPVMVRSATMALPMLGGTMLVRVASQLLCCFCPRCSQAQTEKRIALLIGNQGYGNEIGRFAVGDVAAASEWSRDYREARTPGLGLDECMAAAKLVKPPQGRARCYLEGRLELNSRVWPTWRQAWARRRRKAGGCC
jgi:hypothetical protein